MVTICGAVLSGFAVAVVVVVVVVVLTSHPRSHAYPSSGWSALGLS